MTRTMYQHWLYRAFPLRDDFMESFLVMCTNLAWQPKTSGKVAVKPNVGLEFQWIVVPFVRLCYKKHRRSFELQLPSAFNLTGYLNSEHPPYLFMNQKICVSNRDWMTWINDKSKPERQRRNCFFFRVGSEKAKSRKETLWVEFRNFLFAHFSTNCTKKLFVIWKLAETNVPRKLKKLQSNLKEKCIEVDSSNIIEFFCDTELTKHTTA